MGIFKFQDGTTQLNAENLNALVMHGSIGSADTDPIGFNLDTSALETDGAKTRVFNVAVNAANGPVTNCPAGILMHDGSMQVFIPKAAEAKIWRRLKSGANWDAWHEMTIKGETGERGPSGLLGLEVVEGNLMLTYWGNTAPELSIVNGELIYNY